jgi:hypothetical protein
MIKQYHLASFIILFVLVVVSMYRVVAKSYATYTNYKMPSTPPGFWQAVDFKIHTKGATTFNVTEFSNIFPGKKNSIVKLAPELNGLTGVQVLYNDLELINQLDISFPKDVLFLIGVFRDSVKEQDNQATLSAINFNKGKLNQQALLNNAVSITGLPAVDVYAVFFKEGKHSINWVKQAHTDFIFLGVINASQTLNFRNASLPDGRLWEPFIVEGFYDQKPLFQIIGGPDKPVVDQNAPGAEEIQGGFEGGACVKVGDTYHMFPTERAGQLGIEAYYDRVKTRIGHWTSKDGVHWKRLSTIYQASGNYAITDDDNPLNDRRGAIWSYIPVFNKEKNRWYGYYLTYTVHKEIEPNHSFGRIWQTESGTPGIEGIAGPYSEGKLIMEPGMDSQLWEGRQGVASFFPYPVTDGWLGFYAGAYPYLKREDYPGKSGKGWFVGLAKSSSLDGPWKRLDTTVNPIKSIHPWFVENPIVYEMPNGLYLAIFDGGPEAWGHHLPNMMGYSLSKDGLKWTEAHYLPIQTKVQKWWDVMRTPLCLIPEGNDKYTIIYAAIVNNKRFHPMGMVQVKLNRHVLEEIGKKM